MEFFFLEKKILAEENNADRGDRDPSIERAFFSSLPLDFSLGLLSPFVEATKEAGEWLRLTAILPEMDDMTSAKPF